MTCLIVVYLHLILFVRLLLLLLSPGPGVLTAEILAKLLVSRGGLHGFPNQLHGLQFNK